MQMPLPASRQDVQPVMYISRQATLSKIVLCNRHVSRETLLWQHTIVGLTTACLVTRDCIYASSSLYSSDVYSFAHDGQLLWRIQLAHYAVKGSIQLNEIICMRLADNLLYVLLRNGTLYALHPEEGILLRKCTTEQMVDDDFTGTGPFDLVIERAVLYQVKGNRLFALDVETGKIRWEQRIARSQPFQSHTLYDGVLYACADRDPVGSHIYAYEAQSGRPIWCSALLPDAIFEAPLVVDDYLYCVGSAGVYALQCRNGRLVWSCPVGPTTLRTPLVVGDWLFVTALCDDGCEEVKHWVLIAIQRIAGTPAWYHLFSECPLVHCSWEGQIYVSDEALRKVYCFDVRQGAILFQLNIAATDDLLLPGSGASVIVIDQCFT